MSEPIAAIATNPVPSAIGIVRLSGDGALSLADRVFRPADGRPLSAHTGRHLVYGGVLDAQEQVIDYALAVTFPGPRSYTGEDSAEFQCHGSPVVLQELLRALFALGARQARAGEFTRRAFLNGRMDLMQAESVADLIDAETHQAARNAVGQLDGVLSRRVAGIYDTLMDIVSRFYAVVDYPDEDIAPLEEAEITAALQSAGQQLSELAATFDRGRLLKNGLPTVILGRPNVGKSSLLNALLGYDRAIVTDVAGTTRDTVEEKVQVGGLLLRLIDTAGIRPTDDLVEQIGVERAKEAAERAALALVVLDASAPLSAEDEAALTAAAKAEKTLIVLNKSDLPRALTPDTLPPWAGSAVSVSAKDGSGIRALEEAVAALFPAGAPAQGQILTNPRQADAVRRAAQAVEGALAALGQGLTPDAVLSDAEAALSALGELNGKELREDLVSTIFSRFCVGK